MKKNNPIQIGSALESALRSVNRSAITHLLKIQESWEDVVGAQLAKASTPIKLDKSELVIGVSQPVWVDSMMYLKAEIIKKTNVLFKYPAVNSIRIILHKERAKESHVKKVNKESAPDNKEYNYPPGALSREEEEAVSALPDSQLRSIFKKVILKSHQKDKDEPSHK